MNNEEYKQNEIKRFLNQKHAYYDNVKDFSDSIEDSSIGWIYEQIEWIENGSYGAGACLILGKTYNGLTNRMNKTARIGQVVLRAFYGKEFKYWNKLSEKAKFNFGQAVLKWINKQEKQFAIDN